VGSDFVIAGAMFRNQIPIISRKLTEVALPVDQGTLATLEASVAFTYRPVKASSGRVLYMVTDPLCPYCNEAAKQVRDVADRRSITVKAVLYTVHGDQRTGVGKGYEKAMEAICRGFDFEQYLALAWKEGSLSQTFRCPRGKTLLRLAADAAEALGIDSVPTFILNDGTRITGADMQALDAALDEIF
jgi:thiol:disulfide interchange protein DsbC